MRITMKRMISWCLVLVLVLGMFPAVALAAETDAPTQDEKDVYQIGTAAELLWFAEAVNGGNTGLEAVLTADIDLSNVENWPGIGTMNDKFSGSFDGDGHSVTFKDAANGLFGYVLGSSKALVMIQNVKTLGSIKSSGIAQDASYAQILHCINGATITASGSYVAGIVGRSTGTPLGNGHYGNDLRITECGNEASVSGASDIAGILGYSNVNAKLSGCYNSGNIHGNGSEVGGLAGYLQGTNGGCSVYDSYNTGRITGSKFVGGIVGYLSNTTIVANCYNAGSTTYAIAGGRFNSTSQISNCYFLGTASAKCSPDYTDTILHSDKTSEIQTRASSKTAAEMATKGFAELVNAEKFQQSCPTPVFKWQTASDHTMTGSVCEKCHTGSSVKEVYDVTFQQHSGCTFDGAATTTQGEAYKFTVTIKEGYQPNGAFAIKINGQPLEPLSDGSYAVTQVTGPMSITVIGIDIANGMYAISLPGEGYGYRAEGASSVKANEDYTFKLNFVGGFEKGANFKVEAVEILNQEEINNDAVAKVKSFADNGDGTYTLKNVDDSYSIRVSGVAAVPTVAPVTVNFTVTEGYHQFHDPKGSSSTVMLDQTLTVPYFDLSLYGLEKYYYNPYCYLDEVGNIRSIQQKGTPETAYDNITVMHAFIVATELFYLGYRQEDVGQGISYAANPEAFRKAISWSQDAGSSFMDFWDHGTNLNYYVNYAYPLAYPGWGSTSDQEVLKGGEVISVHLITGPGSGSSFGFFVANDTNNKFTIEDDIERTNQITVDQGQKVKLTYYWTGTTGSYKTKYTTQKNKDLYWIDVYEDGIEATVTPFLTDEDGNDIYGGWHAEPLGSNTLKTDANGMVTINTAGLAPGTYYIGGSGGFLDGGGQKDDDGFESKGSEAGVSFFKLIVREYKGKLGDVDNDTNITTADATQVQQYVAKLITQINDSIADVDGDGKVTTADATVIQQYVAKLISSFPAEN